MARQARVLTVSDSVHESAPQDSSGPALVEAVKRYGFAVASCEVVL
jgi:molybdopterin biosynthesis enzyme MoaB